MHLNRRMRIHSDGHTHTFTRTQHHPPIHRYTDIFSEQVLCTAILASLLEWSFDVEMRISLGNDGDNADSDDNDHDDEEGGREPDDHEDYDDDENDENDENDDNDDIHDEDDFDDILRRPLR